MDVTLTDMGDIVYIGNVAHLTLTEEVRAMIAANLSRDPYEKEEYTND
jgi:hypothetical protein